MVRVDMSSNIDTLTPLLGVGDVEPVASVRALSDETPQQPEKAEPVSETPSSATTTPEEFIALAEERVAAAAHLATEPLMPFDVAVHEGTFQAQKLVEKYAVEQAAEDAAAQKASATRADRAETVTEVAVRRAAEDAAAQQRLHEREYAEAADAAARGVVTDGANHDEAVRRADSERATDEAAAQKRVVDRASEDAAAEAAEAATRAHLDVKA